MIVAVVAAAIVVLWAGMVAFATELGVPVARVRGFRRVLVVFPHADDEAINCGGTLHRLSATGARVTLLLLTKGERGTPDGSLEPGLKDVRVGEARRAAAILGISDLVQADLGDGEVRRRGSDVSALLVETLDRVQPDLAITYDAAGLYGHDDHIACSELVTAALRARSPATSLWYVALPRRLQARVPLEEPLRRRRLRPTHRVFVGLDLLAKTRALRAYRSQREAVWFLLALFPFEHFAAAAARLPRSA